MLYDLWLLLSAFFTLNLSLVTMSNDCFLSTVRTVISLILLSCRIRRSVDTMNRTRVHASINEQRLLQPNERKLLLQSLCNALNFNWSLYVVRTLARTTSIRISRVLKVHNLCLLILVILLDICLRKILLLVII